MVTAQTPKLDDMLCFALYTATRAMTGAYQAILEKLGITYPQYIVLLALFEEDGARVSRIGELLYLDSGTLTPLLKRLEQQGLVERKRGEDDERVVRVYLTPAARRLEKRTAAIPAALFCKIGSSREEIVSLNQTLRKLIKNLNQSRKDES